MKVLHVIDSGGFYGAEAMLLELCKQQRKLGLDPHVLSIGTHGCGEKQIERKLNEHNIPVHLWRMKPLPNLLESNRKIKWAENNGFNLLHSHGYKGNILFCMLPRSARRIPIVTTIHGWTKAKGLSKLRLYEYVDSKAVKKADRIVAVNHQVFEADHFKAVSDSRKVVVLNGIGAEGRNPDPLIHDKIISLKRQGKCVIGTIGRLSHEKGYDVLLKAVSEALCVNSSFHLIIMGEGGQRASLEKLISELKLSNYVSLMGYVDEAGQYTRYFDFYVNSSLTEGLPITLLEAMQNECPIIASGIPANKYLTKNGEFATLAKGCLMNDLKEALLYALAYTKEVKEKAKKARLFFSENYSSKVMAERYLQVYEGLHGRK